MIEQYFSGSVLFFLALFITWSACLTSLAFIISKIAPAITGWSRFWQALLVLALVPLIPTTLLNTDTVIPDILKGAFIESQDSIVQHSNSVISHMESSSELQIFIAIVIAMLMLGTCFSLLRFALALLKVKRFVEQAIQLKDLAGFSENQRQMISAKRIEILVTDRNVSPFVYGFFKVKVLLPKSVFTMPTAQQRLLIAHELMHITRRDPQAVIIFRLCSCLCWFNPFISFIEKHFLQSMELNCDSAVLSVDPGAKLDYARALIASLKLNKSQFDSGVTTYFSGPGFYKQDFENRIKLAMSEQSKSAFGIYAWLCLIMISLFISFVAMASKPFLSLQNIGELNTAGKLPILNGKISSGYHNIDDFRGNKPHNAIDFSAPIGTEVVASFSGWVIIADDETLHKNYGKVVLIEHQGQIQSLYAHLDSLSVEPGQYISAGRKIGTVGNTGRVTGPHLHFEVLKNGKHANPKHYIDLSNISKI